MVKPTDQEAIAIEKTIGGNSYATQGHIGKYHGWSGDRRSKRKLGARGFAVVSAGRNRQGKVGKVG